MKKSKVAKQDSTFARTPPASMAPKEEKSEEECERCGEYDLDHLLKADEIKNDEKRMQYVHKAADKKHAGIRSIQDLKVAANALAAEARIKTRNPKRES